MRDLRDPKYLGRALLFARSRNEIVDAFAARPTPLSKLADYPDYLVGVIDYDANPSCLEKYGDPRLLPSTLPN